MRISGVTYAVRRRSKRIMVLKVFILLIILAIGVSAALSFYIGHPLPFIQKALDTIKGILP